MMDPTMLTKSRMILNSSSGVVVSSIEDDGGRVKPTDFVEFLPWACEKLGVDTILEISKIMQTEYVSMVENKIKPKPKHMKKTLTSESAKGLTSSSISCMTSLAHNDDERVVRITATFSGEHLVHLKIDKTKHLPREILAILNLIVRFYPHLYGITINSGADKYTIHELCKFLPLSHITEINLDNTFIKEANYDTILDNVKHIKVLSLSRCKLEDHTVEKIASKLEYPLLPSMSLSVLNLSSNRLTDKGALSLSKMLRTNRRLSYLNIASNMITDEGVVAILNVLCKFPLTVEEMLIVRGKYLKYLKKRQEIIDQYLKRFQDAEFDKNKKKVVRKSPETLISADLTQPKSSAVSMPAESLFMTALYEKALKMAKEVCGEFEDPLGKDTVSENGVLYSNGNNTLAYLNIAFNSISRYSVKLLLKVLTHQRSLTRCPRGLVNICLEGNPLPEDTSELTEIERLLDIGLSGERRKSKIIKKSP